MEIDSIVRTVTTWRVDRVISETMEETKRNIKFASSDRVKKAWLYSCVGGFDMLQQLGLISDDQRQELYAEARNFLNQ